MTNTHEDHIPPSTVLLEFLQGEWIARCIQMAALLDLAGLVKDEPKSILELAQATNTHAPSLYRLLRALASLGIFAEVEPKRFAQTELSEALRFDIPGSAGYFAKMSAQEWQTSAWQHLEYSIRTGKSAVEHIYGVDVWEYFNTYPEQGQLFNQTLTGLSEMSNLLLTQSYDFSQFSTIVDVGGGQGTFLTTFLTSHPHMRGILFDLPPVIKSADANIKPEFRGRLQLIAGDLLSAVPEGGDAYIMKAVLHDWTDEDCITILGNCRRVMQPGSKLVLIEPLIWPGNGKVGVYYEFLDILMLINSAGRERTAEEFSDILDASGFELIQAFPTKAGLSILEAIPA